MEHTGKRKVKNCLFTQVGWVAQLVEQRTENPCVGGSIPPPATTLYAWTSTSCEGTRLQLPAKLPADGGLGETRQRLAKTPLKLRQDSLAGNFSASDCEKLTQRGARTELRCFVKNEATIPSLPPQSRHILRS